MTSTRYFKLTLTVTLFIVTLSGCSTAQIPPRQGSAFEEIQDSLDQAVQSNTPTAQAKAPPADVTKALLSTQPSRQKLSKKEQRFDIAVSSAPARDMFLGLVENSNYNMVVHPDVTGQVSLMLRNVTIHDVMRTLHNVYGYEYEYHQSDNSFHVLPIRLQSRIFQINYLNMNRSGTSGTRVSSGEITQTQTGEGNNSTGTETLNSSEIVTENRSDFWPELSRALTTIVGAAEGRSVNVNPHTGLVVIRAMPSELREVERFLVATQSNLQKQVILEAKILEVELNDQFQSGINWAAITKGSNDKSILLGQTGGGSVFSGNQTLPGIPDFPAIPGRPYNSDIHSIELNTNTVAGALGSTPFGGVFSMVLDLNDFVGFIELLEGQGNVQVLSSPRISTINNQKAVIKVGSDEFFITDIEANVNTGSVNATTSTDVEFTPFFSGIALDVTPQIDERGMVTLHVHPKISEVTEQVRSIPLSSGENQPVQLARSTVRESDTIVRAQSGQIVVIGGLMQNLATENVAAPPLLGDLPFIGAAFRHTKQIAKKSELVILLRPLVISNGEDWQETLKASGDRIDNLNRGFHYGGRSEIFGSQAEKSINDW